jgi:outer membrane protein OmpA-like peptidoglycan-associated protein
MGRAITLVAGILLALLPTVMALSWQKQADNRLTAAELTPTNAPAVAVAEEANEAYCTPELKQILRRVLTSCGLIEGGGGGRGCQPLEAKNVATMEGRDFNALFVPMKERGAIVQFERASSELDANASALVDRVFADRAGASYFFVVARASQDGATEYNRKLSEQRAQAVMAHLHTAFEDPSLDSQVGLLWLGEEYAQLDPSFCEWPRSGSAERCSADDLNRSAFLAWIECKL